MKPNWQDAPKWAKHLAMDNDGLWWWYEFKPTFDGDGWWSHQGGRMQRSKGPTPIQAETSLESRL